jgi:hypothetical protein
MQSRQQVQHWLSDSAKCTHAMQFHVSVMSSGTRWCESASHLRCSTSGQSAVSGVPPASSNVRESQHMSVCGNADSVVTVQSSLCTACAGSMLRAQWKCDERRNMRCPYGPQQTSMQLVGRNYMIFYAVPAVILVEVLLHMDRCALML